MRKLCLKDGEIIFKAQGYSHDFQWQHFLSYSCYPLMISWQHTHYTWELRGASILHNNDISVHVNADLTVMFGMGLHPITQGGDSLPGRQPGPSTDQPLRGHRPVNVNNASSSVRLNRLPRPASSTSLPHVFLTRLTFTAPANFNKHTHIHTRTVLYLSLYSLFLVITLASLIPSLLQYLIRVSTSCAHFPHQALVSLTTQLLCNLWLCVCDFVCVCAFWEKGEVWRKKTSLIMLLFLSMLSRSMVMRRWGWKMYFHQTHTYIAQTQTNLDLHWQALTVSMGHSVCGRYPLSLTI